MRKRRNTQTTSGSCRAQQVAVRGHGRLRSGHGRNRIPIPSPQDYEDPPGQHANAPCRTRWIRVASSRRRFGLRTPPRERRALGWGLSVGNVEFVCDDRASGAAVAVEAPRGLCGDGEVLAIGTWDLLGERDELLDIDENATPCSTTSPLAERERRPRGTPRVSDRCPRR